jgi:hypothetical protein
MNAMKIMMRKYGGALATRASGRTAYADVMRNSDNLSEHVVFDFEGVSVVTNSFADEVFGRIAYEVGLTRMREATTFRNVSATWAAVIRHAIDMRELDRSNAK